MSDVSINVSPEVIRPIIEAKVKGALIEALGSNSDRIIGEIVTRLLETKVDYEGKPGRGYSNDTSWIEWLVRDLVRGVARQALVELVQEQKLKITQAIRGALKKNWYAMAENFVSHLESSAKENWRTTVNVTFEKPKQN